ncbi:hypothetical protein BB987_14270 [Photorhabdus temperata]|uniref:Uncharacterized protein n=2 Tax=Photorhabdus TaxID=29487 RepID=A0A7X5QNU1_9GAMM|nr:MULTISPECIES: hypothetical protein [Photorhabdus]ETS31449.1 hypothetical protein PTE_02135 [Photorhabdus khanii NC19]NHB97755.1 hypothetical protein [Photorhabdus stackebrandtii]OHV52536.1 hypothetical protein BB987_14270 [Photorhabdus temperata]
MADYIEHYMRMKLEADRILALRAEKAVDGVREVAEDTVNTMEGGFNRLVRRGSYFFDDYRDVNEQINSEDGRFFSALWSVTKGRNPIKEITEVFSKELLKNQSDEAKKRIYTKLVEKLLEISSTFVASRTTKNSISTAVAEIIYQSLIMNMIIREGIKKYGNIILTAFQSYGLFEKAAVSADKLKREHPYFYWALYSKKLEMLYFLVEPALSKGVGLIGTKSSEDDIVSTIVKVISV